ncbi:MAG: hypothetical protein ACTSVA_02860 [Candidatus Njordarchaeales archaeon]
MKSLKSRRRKGFDAERELVKKFKERKIWVTRIPVSGIAQPLPDVLAVAKGILYGFEVKRCGEHARYYRKDFDNLIMWLEAMRREGLKAEAWVSVRFNGGVWRFYQVDTETEKVEANPNIGLTFSHILRRMLGLA